MERGERRRDGRAWISKQISIGNLLTILVFFGTAWWNYSQLVFRVDEHDREIIKLAEKVTKADDRMEKILANSPTLREFDELRDEMRALRTALDRWDKGGRR